MYLCVVFLPILFIALYLLYEMSASVCHKATGGGLEAIVKALHEVICLIVEITVVIYFGKSARYFLPVHFSKSRQGVSVGLIGIVVNVQSLKSVVT